MIRLLRQPLTSRTPGIGPGKKSRAVLHLRKRETRKATLIVFGGTQIMAVKDGTHKKVEWAHLLLCLLVAFCSIEISACAQDHIETRSSVMAGLVCEPERPPPQLADAPNKASSAFPSLSSLFTNPTNGVWLNPAGSGVFPQIPTNHPGIEKYEWYYRDGIGRAGLAKILERGGPYIPVMAEILKANGVPPELLSVALVESKFINSHGRRGNPAGLWQIMPSTARKLGLRVDREVDERLDVVKSTGAAARYLHDLYQRYDNSWPLVLAAYNAGEGSVEKPLAPHCGGDLGDTCDLGHVPSYTQAYVSKVLAVILLARDHQL